MRRLQLMAGLASVCVGVFCNSLECVLASMVSFGFAVYLDWYGREGVR